MSFPIVDYRCLPGLPTGPYRHRFDRSFKKDRCSLVRAKLASIATGVPSAYNGHEAVKNSQVDRSRLTALAAT